MQYFLLFYSSKGQFGKATNIVPSENEADCTRCKKTDYLFLINDILHEDDPLCYECVRKYGIVILAKNGLDASAQVAEIKRAGIREFNTDRYSTHKDPS